VVVVLLCLSGTLPAAEIEVFVSILPQQYFVERIGGDRVNVNVMVKPGQSPETFEPSPKMMFLYSKSNLYFTIGMPFEQVWISRVASLNQNISVISTQPDYAELSDPHSWLSPIMVMDQAKIIMLELSRYSPKDKSFFENNYSELKHDLDVLHKVISERFKPADKVNFMTFHPAFFHFAKLYGLTQIAIEVEGKEPSAKQMAKMIDQYHNKRVPFLLIEKQFNQRIPQTVAGSLNAALLYVDPLSKDYIHNMKDIADKIYRSLF